MTTGSGIFSANRLSENRPTFETRNLRQPDRMLALVNMPRKSASEGAFSGPLSR